MGSIVFDYEAKAQIVRCRILYSSFYVNTEIKSLHAV